MNRTDLNRTFFPSHRQRYSDTFGERNQALLLNSLSALLTVFFVFRPISHLSVRCFDSFLLVPHSDIKLQFYYDYIEMIILFKWYLAV